MKTAKSTYRSSQKPELRTIHKHNPALSETFSRSLTNKKHINLLSNLSKTWKKRKLDRQKQSSTNIFCTLGNQTFLCILVLPKSHNYCGIKGLNLNLDTRKKPFISLELWSEINWYRKRKWRKDKFISFQMFSMCQLLYYILCTHYSRITSQMQSLSLSNYIGSLNSFIFKQHSALPYTMLFLILSTYLSSFSSLKLSYIVLFPDILTANIQKWMPLFNPHWGLLLGVLCTDY